MHKWCNEVINNDEQVTPSDVTAQLQDAPSRLSEEQRKQRIKAFLGGLYPHLDDNMLPKYLRDSMPREKLSVMDIWDLDKDVAYFWHIPKVRRCFASRVNNICIQSSSYHFI